MRQFPLAVVVAALLWSAPPASLAADAPAWVNIILDAGINRAVDLTWEVDFRK